MYAPWDHHAKWNKLDTQAPMQHYIFKYEKPKVYIKIKMKDSRKQEDRSFSKGEGDQQVNREETELREMGWKRINIC